jgi:uncharacterized protein (TIGR03437 family)
VAAGAEHPEVAQSVLIEQKARSFWPLFSAIAVSPVAPVSVQIGGLPAAVEYAGAAPGTMPGLFQINARISPGVTVGDRVPVSVKVGDLSSQQGVTVAIR